MHRDDHPEVLPGGLAAGFAAYLAGRGYSRAAIRHHLHLMEELSTWLGGQGLAAADLSPQLAGRFRGFLRARGSYLVKAASAGPLLAYLRSAGALPSRPADDPAGETGVLLRDYERYLRTERRVSEQTARQYLRYAAEFLEALGDPPDGAGIGARLSRLGGAQVLEVVSRQAAARRPPSLGAVMTGDRALLRFLERAGKICGPLAGAVPMAAKPPSRLPARVDPAAAAAILGSCDRATEAGRRDYAVLLLLHRYGLRPVEVSRLQLPDLHWRDGEFVVHGKAGRVDVLPLLRDAGEAIAEYLQIRRAAPPGTGAVFLSARAPVQPMAKNSVGALIARACTRAGIPLTGPRAFRHAVGHDLLASGASLVEIRDVLRHRDIATTAGYARVGVSALRPLARPWPGSGERRHQAGEAAR